MDFIELNSLFCGDSSTIKDAMKTIDRNGLSIALIVDDKKKFLGLVTDGDIRRALMSGKTLGTKIKEIMNRNVIIARDGEKLALPEKIREDMNRSGYSMKVPVLDKEGRIKDVLLISSEKKKSLLRSKVKPEYVKRVLVVGGAGYLGSLIVKKLLAKNYKVRVLDNLMYGDAGLKEFFGNKNFEFINGDMRDIKVLTSALKNMDAVIHLAGIVGDPACSFDPKETLETNLFATKILAEMCKYYQINRFIFSSTCSVYGESSGENYLDEDSELNPVSLYAESKLMIERMLLEMAEGNFASTIFRMGTLYGASPRMRFDLVINLLTAKAIVDKEITVFGGQQWRPFIHVDDAAEFYIECIELPIDKVRGMVFNIGSEKQNYKIIEIARIINRKIRDAKLVITEKAGDRRNYKTSFNKAYSVFKFRPKKTVENAVEEIKNMPQTLHYRDEKYCNRER